MRRRVFWVVLLAAAALGACGSAAAGLSLPPAGTPAGKSPATIVRISVDELWQRIQGGEDIVVVDVRGKAEYDAGHLPGAVSIPEADFAARAAELSKDRLLIFYCA